jgi:hypothetical protein
MLDRHHHPTTNQHPNTTRTPASTWKTKTVVRTLLVGTAVGTLLLMVGHSKMATRNSSRNVDGIGGRLVSNSRYYQMCYGNRNI